MPQGLPLLLLGGPTLRPGPGSPGLVPLGHVSIGKNPSANRLSNSLGSISITDLGTTGGRP